MVSQRQCWLSTIATRSNLKGGLFGHKRKSSGVLESHGVKLDQALWGRKERKGSP